MLLLRLRAPLPDAKRRCAAAQPSTVPGRNGMQQLWHLDHLVAFQTVPSSPRSPRKALHANCLRLWLDARLYTKALG